MEGVRDDVRGIDFVANALPARLIYRSHTERALTAFLRASFNYEPYTLPRLEGTFVPVPAIAAPQLATAIQPYVLQINNNDV